MITDTETLTGSGAVAADLNSVYDDFGNQTSYTDATGTSSAYTYDLAGNVLSENDGKGTTSLGYSPNGAATTETDSQAGTFTAMYTPDGALASESYPDGTVATYTIDPTGTVTGVTYANAKWAAPISDTVTVNAAGDWSSQTELNASYSYSYDNDDRISSVQDIQSGQCTERAYNYNGDSNRTGLTTYAPGTTGACQSTTAATTETYGYDTADRLVSSTVNGTADSYTYDTQGDIADTPSADAGGGGDLTAVYYANGLVNTQTQAGDTETWSLDPTLSRLATEQDSAAGTTTTNHYSDGSDNPSWSAESNGSWTRNVDGLDGTLGATYSSAGTTTLDLPDLHGDVMATVNTAADAAPSATYTYTEFGAVEPGGTAASPYGYLGGDQRSSSSLGNTVLMGVRIYNPQLGRFEQTDPVVGGNANAYDYVYQNPLTNFDLNGEWCFSWKCIVSGAVHIAISR